MQLHAKRLPLKGYSDITEGGSVFVFPAANNWVKSQNYMKTHLISVPGLICLYDYIIQLCSTQNIMPHIVRARILTPAQFLY